MQGQDTDRVVSAALAVLPAFYFPQVLGDFQAPDPRGRGDTVAAAARAQNLPETGASSDPAGSGAAATPFFVVS